jgi:hypothetical protein
MQAKKQGLQVLSGLLACTQASPILRQVRDLGLNLLNKNKIKQSSRKSKSNFIQAFPCPALALAGEHIIYQNQIVALNLFNHHTNTNPTLCCSPVNCSLFSFTMCSATLLLQKMQLRQ